MQEQIGSIAENAAAETAGSRKAADSPARQAANNKPAKASNRKKMREEKENAGSSI